MRCKQLVICNMIQIIEEYISVDAIICVDACFTQKRHKSQGKGWMPPHEHCETIFIDPEEVAAMENFVETVQPP